MDPPDKELRERLKQSKETDIVFLKRQWREWMSCGAYDKIQKQKGASLHEVYGILDETKLISIKPAEHGTGRYKAILKHSNNYQIFVIFSFDQPNKGNIGIVTYIKARIKKFRKG